MVSCSVPKARPFIVALTVTFFQLPMTHHSGSDAENDNLGASKRSQRQGISTDQQLSSHFDPVLGRAIEGEILLHAACWESLSV